MYLFAHIEKRKSSEQERSRMDTATMEPTRQQTLVQNIAFFRHLTICKTFQKTPYY